MPTQDEKIAAVTAAVEAFAPLESNLHAAEALFDNVLEAVAAANALGLGTPTDFLLVTNGLKAAKGLTADALFRTVTAHAMGTTVAKREGCDVALPASYAIPSGAQPLDGGR